MIKDIGTEGLAVCSADSNTYKADADYEYESDADCWIVPAVFMREQMRFLTESTGPR